MTTSTSEPPKKPGELWRAQQDDGQWQVYFQSDPDDPASDVACERGGVLVMFMTRKQWDAIIP